MVFIWGHLEANPTLTSQKQQISFFHKTPHQAIQLCRGHVQNPTNSKLLCTKTFMVFIWGHFEANPTLTSQKPQISFFHKTPHEAI